jgi:ribose/xylose/arabinose/galactoside ABC-type transport system permease subunit
MKIKVKDTFNEIVRSEYAVLLLLIVIMLVLSLTTSSFMSAQNILNIVKRTANTGIVAIGMTFVICTAGIDLSVGGQVELIAVIGTLLMMNGTSPVLAIIVMIIVGAIAGAVNGGLVSYLKLPAFMVTLAMMSITGGLAFYLTAGATIYKIPAVFSNISSVSVGIIPLPAIYFIVLILIAQILLKKFTLGRRILSIGGNTRSAWYAGINVKLYTLLAYVICGITAAISAVVILAQIMAASPAMGTGMELDAIASAVIGGAALSGGSGNMIGTMAGAIILTSIDNWMNLMSINEFLRNVVKGVIIVLILIFDAWRKGELNRRKLREI